MQEEREHLVKKIFPEIRALCRERGITFTEVDLRWGLTEEEAALGRVIRTCLEEIDKCRPFFLGLVGERYGWAPDMMEYYKDPELFSRWPWLEDAAMEESSITDVEFRHGALNDPESAGHARFFFRDLDALPPSDGLDSQLEDLKNRVRSSGLPHETYGSVEQLGDQVLEQLRAIIDTEFADAKPPSALEEERSRHAAFSASRRHAYIPNPHYLKRLNQWYSSDEEPLILYAESGSGKSSLVAFWCEQMRRKQPDALIIEHYVGIGAGDADHLGIMRHVMEEIKERFDRTEEIPSRPEDLERNFANWLGFGMGAPILLILDGLNQLTGRAADLHWLPPVMPEGLRLVISSTVEATLVDLRERDWPELGMQPLSEREREAVIIRFLAEYRKALSPEQVAQIATDPKSSHPLFLRTLLEELRIHGRHEELGSIIDHLLESTGTEDLFQRVLARFEADHGADMLRSIFSLLWASHIGLTEEDLEELTGVSRLELSTLFISLDYHLVRQGGVSSFFHAYLRRAVETRYMSDEERKQRSYAKLADYFEKGEKSLRGSRELISALRKLGDDERLLANIAAMDRFLPLWKENRIDVMEALSGISREEIAATFSDALDAYTASSGFDRETTRLVANLFNSLALFRFLIEIGERMLEHARAEDDAPHLVRTLVGNATTSLRLGKVEEAENLLQEARLIAEETDDRVGYLSATNSLGNILLVKGEFDEALRYFDEQERVAEDIGASENYVLAVGNKGVAYAQSGQLDKGLEYLEKHEESARRIGDRISAARAVGNLGSLHTQLGNYDEALACFNRSRDFSRDIGDVNAYAGMTGSCGHVYQLRGEYAETIQHYLEALEIHRSAGIVRPCAIWLNGLAGALLEVVKAHEARPEFLSELLPDITEENWEADSLEQCRRWAEESEEISRSISAARTLFTSRFLQIRIEAAGGREESAVERARKMAEEELRDVEQAELHFFIWKNGDPETAEEHGRRALELYRRSGGAENALYAKNVDQLSEAFEAA